MSREASFFFSESVKKSTFEVECQIIPPPFRMTSSFKSIWSRSRHIPVMANFKPKGNWIYSEILLPKKRRNPSQLVDQERDQAPHNGKTGTLEHPYSRAQSRRKG
jgi:hypothetical protein